MNYFKHWYFFWKGWAFIAAMVFMYAVAQLGVWACVATVAGLFFWTLDSVGEYCWREYTTLKPLYEAGILKRSDDIGDQGCR